MLLNHNFESLELIIRIGMLWWRKRDESEVYGPLFFFMTFVIVYPTARMAGALHQLSRPNGFIKVLWDKSTIVRISSAIS